MKNEASDAGRTGGWRETGDPAGLVMHLRIGASVLCLTRRAHAATTQRSEVNCVKCLGKIARIWPAKAAQ